MNETAKKKKEKKVRELCSLLTIRHALMIIGWEDASAAVSKKCNPLSSPFLLLYTQHSAHCCSFFPLLLWRIMESQQRVPSSLGRGCDYLGGAAHKDCIMSQCVTLAQICNYAAQWLLQCEEQFIRISGWIQNTFFWLTFCARRQWVSFPPDNGV